MKKVWLKWLWVLIGMPFPLAIIYALWFKLPTILDMGFNSFWFYLGIAVTGLSIIIPVKLILVLVRSGKE